MFWDQFAAPEIAWQKQLNRRSYRFLPRNKRRHASRTASGAWERHIRWPAHAARESDRMADAESRRLIVDPHAETVNAKKKRFWLRFCDPCTVSDG